MRLALVLGGGGMKGAAHIGIIQGLEERGIRPDLIVGTSAGSIVGCLYASGMGTAQLVNLYANAQPDRVADYDRKWAAVATQPVLMRLLRWPLGLLKGNKVEAVFFRLLGDKTFDQLTMPCAAVAVDINSGEMVVFAPGQLVSSRRHYLPPEVVFITRARVAEAIRASISIPGLFAPKEMQGRMLVDGGLVDNTPADVARWLGAEKVIAVDLGFQARLKPADNILEVLIQSADVMGRRITEIVTGTYADLVLRPISEPVSLWEFGKVPALVEAGRSEVERRWSEIEACL
ncbi:MAG: patatin-like phospholipase family protein [Clostridia bacterium]|nr:patatin-like phospholipase family protein [Clostridia bacterium]